MNELQVFWKDGIEVADSRDVARMVERNHNELLKTIRVYCDYLDEGEIPLIEFFIESSYLAPTGKKNPCYLITKKGCDMIANKMTGAKGILFTAAYVTAFEKMRERLQKPMTQAEIVAAQGQLLVDMERRIETVERKAEEAVAKLDTALKVYSHPSADHWRGDVNAAIDKMVDEQHQSPRAFRGRLYQELETAARCNLVSRLNRLQERMRRQGMTYKDAKALTKLDAIAADSKLRVIFEGIIKRHQARGKVSKQMEGAVGIR